MPNRPLLPKWNQRDGLADTSAESVFIIGLGRFGTALGTTLMQLGKEVMAVDTDQALVDRWAEHFTHVRTADGTSVATLEQLGVRDFDAAVVAIGTGIEASVLSTAALVDLDVTQIWAKAITNEHGRILTRVGAHHVVYPEREMGERVAHVVAGQVIDYFELDDGFVLVEIGVPSEYVGVAVGDSDIRQRYDVTLVCIKPAGGAFTYVTPETVLGPDDLLVVAGMVDRVDRFAGK